MFKPTVEHLEELLRAREICLVISDELPTNSNNPNSECRTLLKSATEKIETVLESFFNQLK